MYIVATFRFCTVNQEYIKPLLTVENKIMIDHLLLPDNNLSENRCQIHFSHL